MDIFCPRCGAMDGTTPDQHPCMQNLLKELERIKAMPSQPGYQLLSRKELVDIEEMLMKVYEAMRGITAYWHDKKQEADRAQNTAYNYQQNARKEVRIVRELLRNEHFGDPE